MAQKKAFCAPGAVLDTKRIQVMDNRAGADRDGRHARILQALEAARETGPSHAAVSVKHD